MRAAKVDINPLSVNDCWKGRRFKTDVYKAYERELLFTLKKIKDIPDKIHLDIKFGFSSKLKDIDNPVKPFIDILQKKYGFNDRNIFKLTVEKEIVKKGKEFIKFEIHGI